jgi:hypothetical protein
MHHAQRRFFDAVFDQQWKAGQIALQIVGKTINSPLLTHKIARSLSLIRIFVLLLLTHIFARI